MADFDPNARCHWKAKGERFFPGETCRHTFKKHLDAEQHVDKFGTGFACTGGHDDDEDTWCCCPGFEPSAESRRFPDVEEQKRYEEAMRGA